MRNCCNCAWFCHSDESCYKPGLFLPKEQIAPKYTVCNGWSFDGLDDWEREQIANPSNILMTMEAK